MKKKKISVTTGTRAEYGILRPLLEAISTSEKLDLYLIVVGMHLSKKYGLTINEIKKDGFKIYATINTIPQGDSPLDASIALGRGIIEFSKIFDKLKPDINLVLGDRDEMLESALAAYHMNILNAHVHGGERSGGIDEYTRHAITKISNIHFAVTNISKKRILRMGENPKHVFLTGSPSLDEIVNDKITTKKTLERKYDIQFSGHDILLLQHPVTTQPQTSERHILNTLKAIVKLKKNTIAIAPNSDAGNAKIFKYLRSFSKKHEFIRMYESVPRCDYLGLLRNCAVLVGNSSSGIIEASYFNTPVVNIGIRQKGREKSGNVIDVECVKTNAIYRAILKAFKRKNHVKNANDGIYGSGKASSKIVKILEKINLDENLIQKQITY